MNQARITFFASALAITSGALWGFYWVPVRALDQAGVGGAWGTFAITSAACLLMMPLALWHWVNIRSAHPIGVAATALGGAAFTLYSVAFVYGEIGITVLLFFLSPVWSTLIGRFIFGWHTPLLRVWAIGAGLIGLTIMLSADGTMPIPRNLGEWMGLTSGALWAVGSTGMRLRSTLQPAVAAWVFAIGAAGTALMLGLWLGPIPQIDNIGLVLGISLGTGGLWWGGIMIALMWATVRLDPARIGILLMSEVVIGTASAALIAGEYLSPLELAGGGFVLCAGLLELWPIKTPHTV